MGFNFPGQGAKLRVYRETIRLLFTVHLALFNFSEYQELQPTSQSYGISHIKMTLSQTSTVTSKIDPSRKGKKLVLTSKLSSGSKAQNIAGEFKSLEELAKGPS